MSRLASALALALTISLDSGCSSCRKDPAVTQADAGDAGVPRAPASATSELGAPRPGMAWIPAGTLVAGTPAGKTPRVADEEMAGVSVEMQGFYIDLLPWPNEPNAIPTTNVTRDAAEQLCASKGKRLCTELEWERACKGPDNTTYEYGDTYRVATCGMGVAPEQAAHRPTGEHAAACKSGFGVTEMHGGVWEWTSSSWGSRAKAESGRSGLGVLRGGNSLAGELAGRCANALARSPSKSSATMGLRCCAGPKNDAEVKLTLGGTPGITAAASDKGAPITAMELGRILTVPGKVYSDVPLLDPKSVRVFTWTPVNNEELVVETACSDDSPKVCGLIVVRLPDEVLAKVVVGKSPPEVSRPGDARHLRLRALDARGIFSREITYAYGRVEIGELKRP